jgi:hypothetical protein
MMDSRPMDGDTCRVCAKPLGDEISPTVTDRAGRYHFACWPGRVNVATEETRNTIRNTRAAIAKGRAKPANADLDLPARGSDGVT